MGLVDEGPCFGSVELANRQGVQYRRFKVAYVNSHIVLGTVQRLPMRTTAANLAAEVSQGLVTPDILERVFRVTVDAHSQPREACPKPPRCGDKVNNYRR